MANHFHPANPDTEIMNRIKAAFGSNNVYSLKAWSSPIERDQGISTYLADELTLEDAMARFDIERNNHSSVEIVYVNDNEETAICIAGRDNDVLTPEWVCLSEI